jgi:hypothetical protein
MRTIPFVGRIANAAARWVGTHGTVTATAHQTGCSRQCAYDHARKVLAAVEAQHGGGPTREGLIQQNDVLRREAAQLWDWLFQTIEFPLAKQQEFAATALAMGLSLNQILTLLTLLLGTAACPGRSTVHRWAQAASAAAGRVLKRLDRAAQTLVLVGCLDEIFFHRRPVLVGVEPHSMVWFLGKKADNCQGTTWFEELKPWRSLRRVICDAGSGLQAGLVAIQKDRRANPSESVPLETGLDVFHTKREAGRVLTALWNRLERLWEQAEAAGRAAEWANRQGRDGRGPARTARFAWKKATAAFRRYEAAETAWKCAAPALNVFRPDGRLNDRSWARAQIVAAVPGLSGSEWSKVRGSLEAEAALTFLDRLHQDLGQLGLAAVSQDALVELWWSRRQRPRSSNPQAPGGYGAVAPLVQQLLCQQLDPNWRQSYREVAAVLSRTVRASSAVECRNSVLRMHQSRHRTLTQGMLDRKRLYRNTRVFRGGKRKGRCPYEHLGLVLPRRDFWGSIQDELNTAKVQAPTEAPGIAA